MILIDTREPKKVFQYMDNRKIPYKTDVLAYGDYLILGTKNIAIERKDIFDLFNSVDDGRLWEQLIGLEKYDGYQKILLVEGSLSYAMGVRKSITFARWMGTLGSVLAGWNISVITTTNLEASLLLIQYLDKKLDGSHTAEFRKPNISKAGRTLEEEAKDVLMAVDGIGGKTVESMLEEIGSIKDIVKAKPEKLAKVLNDKKAKHLIDVFQYKKEAKEETKE